MPQDSGEQEAGSQEESSEAATQSGANPERVDAGKSGANVKSVDAKMRGGSSESVRKVVKTLLEADSPDLKKIRKILQSEPQATPGKKVAKTLLNAALPSQPPARKIARTMLDTQLPKFDKVQGANVEDTTIQPLRSEKPRLSDEPETSGWQSVAKRVEGQRQFTAKTMLDHNVLADTLLKFEIRKEKRVVEEAIERANQPVKEFHPVESKRLIQRCPWSWDDESSKDKFLYCSKCKVQVYNFDGMELQEAEALIFTRENNKVPTLYKRADGKFMTRDCPVQVKRKKRFVLLSVVGATVFFVFMTMVIVLPPPSSTKSVQATTADVSESNQPETIVRTVEQGTSSRNSLNAQVEYQRNADGTTKRKRPTFTPDDEKSYWE